MTPAKTKAPAITTRKGFQVNQSIGLKGFDMNVTAKRDAMEVVRPIHTRLPHADEFLGTAEELIAVGYDGVWPTEHKISKACFPGTERTDRIVYCRFGDHYTWKRPLHEADRAQRLSELIAEEGAIPDTMCVAGWFRDAHRNSATSLIQLAVDNLAQPKKALDLLLRAQGTLRGSPAKLGVQ